MLSENSRLCASALLVSLLLFAGLFLFHLWAAGTWLPFWFLPETALNALFLGLLLTGYRPALRQLPLFLFALSAMVVRPLTGMTTLTFHCYTYLAFVSGLWGLLALLTPTARFPRVQRAHLFLAGFLFTLPAALIWLYYLMAGAFPTPEILLSLMQTNPSEAAAYAEGHLSLLSAAAVPLYFLFLGLTTRPTRGRLWRKAIVWPLLCIPLYFLLDYGMANPICQLPEKTLAFKENYTQFQESQKVRSRHLASLHLDSREKGLFVLVIGESQNSEHMGVYGYHRDTTPWLSSEVGNSHFFLFRDAYSCHVQTVPTLAYALTAQNQYNHLALVDAPSLLEAAKAAGFTTAWVSNQVRYSAWDTPTTIIASQADRQIWLNSSAGLSTDLDYQDDALVDALDRLPLGEKNLVILHLMGSHMAYIAHYPKAYEIYDSSESSLNAYDNTICFNDAVMEKLYHKLQSRKDFQALVYLSDHSEAIDEGRDHNPTTYTPDMTYISFYMALSDSYLESHEAEATALRNHEHSRFTNDLLFNAMTSLLGIRIPGLEEKENDITSPTYDDTPSRFRTLYGAKGIVGRRE